MIIDQHDPQPCHRAATLLQLTESEERAFVHIVAIDPEQRGAILVPRNFVRRPKLVDKGFGFAHARRTNPWAADL